MMKYNDFLKEKTQEIASCLQGKEPDMYELIGSVRDLFSSAYNAEALAGAEVIEALWGVLLTVFHHGDRYDNRFQAIFTMSDINLYARRREIDLSLASLRQWRKKGNSSGVTPEILECVDDILTGAV